MKNQDYNNIPAEKFTFCAADDRLHDMALETKPVTSFRDALNRFARNKGSIVAFCIIMVLLLFALIAPLLSPYEVSYNDAYYRFVLPKNQLFYDLGIPFWDGGQEKEVNKATFDLYRGIEEEIGRKVIMDEPECITEEYMGKTRELYRFRLDTYNAVGLQFVELNLATYKDIQQFQDEKGVQIIYPITDPKLRPASEQDKRNANIWYQTKVGAGKKTAIVYDKEGNFIPIYQANDGKDEYTSKMLWEGDTKQYNYAQKMDGDSWLVRVDYRQYYAYVHRNEGITEPSFLLGTTDAGQDIFTCLASGARFSFILAIVVASVNLFVGAIYGSIEGYYGGKIDLTMERIVDLLASIPFMIVITLLKYHLNVSHMVILFISFFLTGWTGIAGRTRMQFYRFKNQEYVLAARTLGAKDARIMFKHIFPNAIGTLITSSVLIIPGVIFSETSLTYLGIIDLNTGDLTSIGTLLAKGQNYLFTYPHIILFPAVFISLLMLSFNLFGNGLRDAFNPSLRGTED